MKIRHKIELAIPLVIPLCLFVFFSCGKKDEEAKMLRVAALQFYPEMTKTQENLETIITLSHIAAQKGAKIVVTPECALQGYCHPPGWTSWTTNEKEDEDQIPIANFAEEISGDSSRTLAKIADELDIYLCVGMVEKADGKYYNSQILFNPDGKIIAHHRKKAFWPPGDAGWCSKGSLPVQVVDTELGRLGLMICKDYQLLPGKLLEKNTDIVLYSVGWYGPNEETWFTKIFPRDYVVPYGYSVILANWSGKYSDDDWPGRGCSCIIDKSGKVLDICVDPMKECVVLADIPAPKVAEK
jgi:predicted amidohydrolase